jgi:hypothetical protein
MLVSLYSFGRFVAIIQRRCRGVAAFLGFWLEGLAAFSSQRLIVPSPDTRPRPGGQGRSALARGRPAPPDEYEERGRRFG